MSLNLASNPFVNRRPVKRAGIILLVLGAVLLALNAYLYWNHLSGQGVAESGLQELADEFDRETELLRAAHAEGVK